MRAASSSLERYRFLDRRVSPLYALFVGVAAAGVLTSVVGAALLEIDVVVKAPSQIRPVTNISTLKNATPGSVEIKAYSHGDRVSAGDLLWRIDTTASEVNRRNALAQLQRLRADRDQLTSYALSLEAGKNTVPLHFSEAYHKAEAYFTNLQRLHLLCSGKKERWDQESLLPPAMTVAQKLKDLKDDWQLSLLDLAKTQAEESEKVFSDRKALLSAVEALEQRLAELGRLIREAEVHAPIAGVVEDVKKFNAQDFLVAGEELVRIVPDGTENLKLEIKVDTRDIAEVREGQMVTCLFSGLPPSRYGHIEAKITNVPADALVVDGQLACFVVEAVLTTGEVKDRRGRRLSLKPGMEADSRIVVSKKPVLTFLLEKLEFIQ